MVLQRLAVLGPALFSVGAAGAGYISNTPGLTAPVAMVAASAAATTAAPQPSASTAPGNAPSSAPSATNHPDCDDGRWQGAGGVNVEGRPDGFDAGDRGAVYVWHDHDGWHLRATDVLPTDHHYSGEIRLSAGARFTDFRTVKLDPQDTVWVTGDNILHYRFNTHNGIDGIDYRVSGCDQGRDREVMVFNLKYNGSNDDIGRIRLGDNKEHPKSVPFAVHRSVDS